MTHLKGLIFTDGTRQSHVGILGNGTEVIYSTPIVKTESEAWELLDKEIARLNNEGERE